MMYRFTKNQALTMIIVIASVLPLIYITLIFTDQLPSSIPILHLNENYSHEDTIDSDDVIIGNFTDVTVRHQHKEHEISQTALEIQIEKMVQKQKVFVLPNITATEAKGELSHFILDGINRSTVLQRTFDIDDTNAVWVIDLVRFDCRHKLVPLVWDSWKRRGQTGGNPQPWDIYILDFHDGYTFDTKCVWAINGIFNHIYSNDGKSEHFTSITDDDKIDYDPDTHYNFNTKSSVHYATRRHTEGRYINTGIQGDENKSFSILGRKVDYNGTKGIDGVVRVLRYGVRNDLVIELQRQQQVQIQNTTINDTDIINWPRPYDIAHFWGAGDDKIAGKLRSAVSEALVRFSGENPSLIILAQQVGSRYNLGRNEVSESYAAALLQYKIVVVCQRDMWEDHYRLMEALAGGAMVMTDSMHPLPFKLEEGKEVIVYRSIAELKQLAKYFLDHEKERLKIARSGFEVAMRFHRSPTWMERIIFGDWGKEHGDS